MSDTESQSSSDDAFGSGNGAKKVAEEKTNKRGSQVGTGTSSGCAHFGWDKKEPNSAKIASLKARLRVKEQEVEQIKAELKKLEEEPSEVVEVDQEMASTSQALCREQVAASDPPLNSERNVEAEAVSVSSGQYCRPTFSLDRFNIRFNISDNRISNAQENTSCSDDSNDSVVFLEKVTSGRSSASAKSSDKQAEDNETGSCVGSDSDSSVVLLEEMAPGASKPSDKNPKDKENKGAKRKLPEVEIDLTESDEESDNKPGKRWTWGLEFFRK